MKEDIVEVRVTGIAMANTPQGPVPVALLEDANERVLLLVMDGSQAMAVQSTLDGQDVPSTHSFILNLLNTLNASVKQAVIYGVSESRFLSKVAIDVEGELKEVEGRAGDIVTLAFVAKAPIMVSDEVMEKVAINKSELYRPSEPEEESEEGPE